MPGCAVPRYHAPWLMPAELRKLVEVNDREDPAMAENENLDVVGMWVTADGHIRQELLPDGRYDEARGDRRSAYTGRYTVTGNHIDYIDDTGFTATGDIRDGVLYHEHLVLYREEQAERRP
ncbi:protein Atu4866 [Actinomadura meyerae]|uniref:Protein Atu4866 n=2 Tax=Actinomadura meyerae TaxID=240840 RepID=A0A239JH90_9ACTN|nr:protein Atu4866 [Actinomadura meyerae]